MTAPLVSAVIPVWNGAHFLAEALASVRAQRWQPLEIIVVDDGSTDDTPRIARATSGVRTVRQDHAGVAAARNRGLDEARGEVIAWLDADDMWLPDKLEVQVRFNLQPMAEPEPRGRSTAGTSKGRIGAVVVRNGDLALRA